MNSLFAEYFDAIAVLAVGLGGLAFGLAALMHGDGAIIKPLIGLLIYAAAWAYGIATVQGFEARHARIFGFDRQH